MSVRIAAPSLAALALAALLAGCAPTVPTANPTPSKTASPTASATPTPTATAAASVPATCENLLDPQSIADITASGFVVDSDPDYIAKIRGEGAPYPVFIDYGGILCVIHTDYRVAELLGYSPISEADAATQQAALAAQGFVASSTASGVQYTDESGGESVVSVYLFSTGHWWCANSQASLDEIVRNSPAS